MNAINSDKRTVLYCEEENAYVEDYGGSSITFSQKYEEAIDFSKKWLIKYFIRWKLQKKWGINLSFKNIIGLSGTISGLF